MRLSVKLALYDEDGTRFFGYGIYQILLGIRKTGSLRAAAMEMGMAYSKAFRIVKTAETYFGFPLTRRTTGGTGGGGSELTEQAEDVMKRYEALLKERDQIEKHLFETYFSDFQ